MPPFVMKIKFYKPGLNNSAKNAAHVNYIATRPGADRGDIDAGDRDPVPVEPDSPAGHVKYAAERPRSHGLFGEGEKTPDLESVQEELGRHDGVVWRFVLSLREDTAKRMGYIDRKSWENALRAGVPEAARAMGIPESNLRWVAAYHAETGHPHVHLVMWERRTNRNRGILSPGERRDVRKAFIRSIYAAERSRFGVEKTAIRDMIRDVARGEMNRVRDLVVRVKSASQEVQAMDGGPVGVAPRLSDSDREDLARRLEKLAAIMPGKGRVALKYMPEEVKVGAREIADWLLAKPGFAASAAKYREIAREMAGHYTSQEQKLSQAEENAYNDLRDRVAQIVLKTAVQVPVNERQNEQQNIRHIEADEPQIPGIAKDGNHGRRNAGGVSENLWRSAGRASTRAIFCIDPEINRDIAEFNKNLQSELDTKLRTLAAIMPEDTIGQPPLAALPEEVRAESRKIADWILQQNGAGFRYKNLVHERYGKETAIRNTGVLRDKIAEKVVAIALQLLPREMPDIEMRVHQGRLQEALACLRSVDGKYISNEPEEAEWTAGTMYRALVKMGMNRDSARELVINWSRTAGVNDPDDIISREEKRMAVIEEKFKAEGRDVPVHISKADWNRMRDNLGLDEEKLLSPWFGVKKTENGREEDKQFEIPEIIPENIERTIAAFKSATPQDISYKEFNWTIRSMAQVLYALGVSKSERDEIVKEWASRACVNISEARLRDILDRLDVAGRKDFFLGPANWQRLNKNLGVNTIPAPPWKYKYNRIHSLSLAGNLWRSAWQAIERARSREEARGEMEKRVQDERRMRREKEKGQERER